MILILALVFLVLFVLLAIAWRLGKNKRLKETEPSIEDSFRKHFLVSKAISIEGMTFLIRKINPLDYLEGAKVLAEVFSVYKTNQDKGKALENLDSSNINKLKSYLTDIICAGCVKPKFTRDEIAKDPNEIPIKELFNDWLLAQRLAQEIFDHTHGKKK